MDSSSRIKSIEHLVLNTANIERSGMQIFRLYGFEQWILISDKLKQQLEAVDIKGVAFKPING